MAKQTKEVVVIDFEKFSIAQLPELQGKKEEIASVIKANPIVEIVDNPTYELAKKSRTAVKTLRTGLEKEQKDVKKKIKEFVLDVVDGEYSNLVSSVKYCEELRQNPITAWEDKKEQERLEKVRLEELRVKQIKEAIQTFKDAWIQTVDRMLFNGIENFFGEFEKVCDNFNRNKLAEYEVLFDDAIIVVRQMADVKIKNLTELEEIRLEQIRLAEECEKQRIENERIAEEQRIAQDKFLKEKKEFEEKQAESKFQERCKQITELGFVLNETNIAYQKGLHYLNLEDIRLASDDLWLRELEDTKNIKDFSEMEVVEVSDKEVEFEDYNEADVDVKGVVNTNDFANYKEEVKHIEQIPTKSEVTWESILEDYKDKNNNWDFLSQESLINWLYENYNVPTKKQ